MRNLLIITVMFGFYIGNLSASNGIDGQNPPQKTEKTTSNRICPDQW